MTEEKGNKDAAGKDSSPKISSESNEDNCILVGKKDAMSYVLACVTLFN